MIAFLIENLGTIIVSLIIFTAIVFIVRKIIKDRKNNSCGCGCSGCGKEDGCKH